MSWFIRTAVLLAAAVSLATAGCGGSSSSSNVFDKQEHQFVADELTLPFSQAEADTLGADLDGDGNADNRFSEILQAVLAFFPPNPHQEVATIMATGRIIHLFSLYADDPQSEGSTAVWAFLGQELATPGTPAAGGSFTVDTAAVPGTFVLDGAIAGGVGSFGDGTGTLAINLPITSSASVALKAEMVQLDFDVATDGSALMNGRIAGAVRQSEVETKVVASINAELGLKCSLSGTTCTCETDSGAGVIQDMLDTDDSCDIDLTEIQNNALISNLLEGDVTLPDGAAGLSFGFGFHAVAGTYTHAAPPQ